MKKNIKKTIISLVLFLSFMPLSVLPFSVCVYADNGIVSSTKTINLSSGKVDAETCKFSMVIPSEWKDYLRAYHEYLPVNSRMMEKIEFYFFPVDKTAKPVRLLSINIYDKRFWMEGSAQWKLLFQSDNYVFTVYTAEKEPDSSFKVDKIIYAYYEEKFTDINYLRSLMTFPEKEGSTENSVIIDSVILKGAVAYNSKNVAYLPVRLCCEALGYDVLWKKEEKSIAITKKGFEFVLATEGLQKSYNTYLLDGSYYVSAFFFMNVLETGIEIDERGNVYITK